MTDSIKPCVVSLQMQLDAANKRIAELEKDRDELKSYKRELQAKLKYWHSPDESQARNLEQQAKGRIDGVAYALNMYCVHMSPKEFPAIGEYYAGQVLNQAKALKGGE